MRYPLDLSKQLDLAEPIIPPEFFLVFVKVSPLIQKINAFVPGFQLFAVRDAEPEYGSLVQVKLFLKFTPIMAGLHLLNPIAVGYLTGQFTPRKTSLQLKEELLNLALRKIHE